MKHSKHVEQFVHILHKPRTTIWQLALGQALLLTTGALVSTSIWFFHATDAEIPVLAAVSAVMLAVVLLTPRMSWSGPDSHLPLFFPLCVLAGLAAVGYADSSAAPAYVGILDLCFVYVGLTQPSGTSLLLVPVAAGTWLIDQHAWSAEIAVKLAISVLVWLVVGELLSYRSERATEARLALAAEAHTDSLTGLINRRALDTRLSNARNGDTVVMLDLDHFKELNDHGGHHAGDRALAAFGLLLQSAVRGADAAGRYGGDEFVLLLADTSPEAALEVLHRIRAKWTVLHPDLTFSSGVAAVEAFTQVQSALDAADEALYVSKQAGRNADRISYEPAPIPAQTTMSV